MIIPDHELPANKKDEIMKILMKLCEKMGRRLREHGSVARGIHLALYYGDHTHFNQGKTLSADMVTTLELYKAAEQLFVTNFSGKIVKKMSVTCFNLCMPEKDFQDSLFDTTFSKRRIKMRLVTPALDIVNDRYGEFSIFSGRMLESNDLIPERIAFGNVRGD